MGKLLEKYLRIFLNSLADLTLLEDPELRKALQDTKPTDRSGGT